MTKKGLITLFCIIIVIVIAIIMMRKISNKGNQNESTINIESSYDEETGLYYIKDEETRRNNLCKS